MKSQSWTIIIKWSGRASLLTFSLSKRLLLVLLVSFLAILSVILGMTLQSLGNREDYSRYILLEGKRQAFVAELGRLSVEIDSLRAVMSSLTELDKGMRVATGLRALDPEVRALGIGGSREDTVPIHIGRELRDEILSVQGSIKELERGVAFEHQSYEEILKSLRTQKDLLAHTPSIFPASGVITSGFGWRYNNLLRRREFHKGLDIANKPGTPIFSPADGVVTYRGWKKGFGRFLTIDHGYGYKTRYGHLRRSLVSVGERVSRGQIIAHMGNSGLSTGPHLHYEVLVLGTQVNPKDYIAWEFTRY